MELSLLIKYMFIEIEGYVEIIFGEVFLVGFRRIVENYRGFYLR